MRYYKSKSDTSTFRKEVFYSSGKKGYVGQINKGKKNGLWIWWYSNGTKKDQCLFKDGVYLDTVFHWKDDGILYQIEIVTDQKVLENECCNCNGRIIRYYDNGKKKEEFTNIKDQFEGFAYKWDSLGNLTHKTLYKNNKEVKLFKVIKN